MSRIATTFTRLMLAAATLLSLTIGPRYAAPGLPVMGALLIASFAASLGGFAFSAIGGALLLRLVDNPVAVVQLLITCSIAIQATATWSLRREIAWRATATFLLGGIAGLPIGIWLLLHGGLGVTRLLGFGLLTAGATILWRRPTTIHRHPALDILIGVLGGITGGAAGLPSAPVALWCSLKDWSNLRHRAVLQPYVLVMQIGALLAISLCHASHPGPSCSPGTLLCIPVCLCGTLAGLACYRRLAATRYTIPATAALMTSGMACVV